MESIWKDAKLVKPNNGKAVLLLLKDGDIREGQWIGQINKFIPPTNKWEIYRKNKVVPEDEVVKWCSKNLALKALDMLCEEDDKILAYVNNTWVDIGNK